MDLDLFDTVNQTTDELTNRIIKENEASLYPFYFTEKEILGVGLFAWYKNDILNEASDIAMKYDYIWQNVEENASVGEKEALKKLLTSPKDKLFFIFAQQIKTDKFEWGVLVVINLGNYVKILFKSVRNDKIPGDIEQVLKSAYSNKTLEIIINQKSDNGVLANGGHSCLKYLDKILEQLKTNESEFINSFKNFDLTGEAEDKLITINFKNEQADQLTSYIEQLFKTYSWQSQFPDHIVEQLRELLKSENFFKIDTNRDIKIQVLEWLSRLIKIGLSKDEIFETIIAYYNNTKEQYLKKIDDCNKNLLENPREDLLKKELQASINNGIKFILYIYSFIPEHLKCLIVDNEILDTLIKFINKVYEDEELLENAENEKQKLRNTNENSSSYEDNLKIQKKIDFYMAKNVINSNNYADDLVVMFENVIECGNVLKCGNVLNSKTVSWIANAGLKTKSETIAITALKILKVLPQNSIIKNNLDGIFVKLNSNFENLELVLGLGKKFKFLEPCKGMINLIIETIESECGLNPNDVPLLERLKETLPDDLNQTVTEIVEMEQKCASNDEDLLQFFLDRVKLKKKLTFNCFKVFSDPLKMTEEQLNTVQKILLKIVDNDIQRLPKYFVDKFKEMVKTSKEWNVISFCVLLIKGDYIILSDITELENIISDKIERDKGNTQAEQHLIAVLDLIYLAFQKGQKVSESLIDKIDKLLDSDKKTIVFNRIRGIETSIEIFNNPRKLISDRKKALQNVMQDKRTRNQYTAKILENIILFDKELNIVAFQALLAILEENKKCRIDLKEILLALQDCELHVNDIDKLIKITNYPAEFVFIIDLLISTIKLNFQNKSVTSMAMSQLKIISNKVKGKSVFSKEHAEQLSEIAWLANDSTIKNDAISVLENAFSIEQLLTTHLPKDVFIQLKTVQCDLEKCFTENLSGILSNGYRLTLDQITDILQFLNKPSYENDYVTQLKKLLFLIDKNQGLNEFTQTICERVYNKTISSAILNNINADQNYLIESNFIDYLVNFCTEKLISNQLQFKELAIEQLNTVQEEQNLTRFKIITFRCLNKYLNFEDLDQFYVNLKIELKTENGKNEKNALQHKYNAMDAYYNQMTNKDERYSWLRTLSTIVLYNHQVNPNSFRQIDLLGFAFLQSANETQDDIIESFNALSEKVPEQSLDQLLIKQSHFHFPLKQINQILKIISDFPRETFKLISEYFSKADKFLIAIKNLWLKLTLKKRDVKFADQPIENLSKILFRENSNEHNVEIDWKSLAIKVTGEDIESPKLTYQTNCVGEYLLVLKKLLEKRRNINNAEIVLSGTSNYKSVKYFIIELSIHDHFLNINTNDIKMLRQKLFYVFEIGWSLDSIDKLLRYFNDHSNDRLSLIRCLDIIFEYKLREYEFDIDGKILIEIFNSSANLIKKIHSLALFQSFKGTFDKPKEILNAELNALNDNNCYLQNKLFETDFKKIGKFYNSKSKWAETEKPISKWNKSDIEKWTDAVQKEHSAVQSLIDLVSFSKIDQWEKIAVVKRAIELTSEFEVRDIQLISLLCLLNCEKDKGRLLQINTGEGKTSIVAMFAAIKAMDGYYVDVITSSPELAKPQSEQQKPFFDLFGITVSHNVRDGKKEDDIKEVYKSRIVYGAASDFQGDVLRDEFSKLGTRSHRKFDIAIVDEVDSMLIDGKNHIVMLSSQMPGMNHLEPLLAVIWLQLENIENGIRVRDGKHYFVIQNSENGNAVQEELLKNKLDFVKNRIEVYVRKLLRDYKGLKKLDEDIPDKYPELKIPKHLMNFVKDVQLVKWIDSAIAARNHYKKNQHYLINEEGKITPVDSSNTGVVQQNTNWSNGLHQFLQLKHGLKVVPESLPTNYISNVSFFKRYGKHIYGLTGTLGSENSKKFLRDTYNVDCVIVPPFRKKQHQELTSIIVDNESEWYEAIVDSTLNKLSNNRGVLIITKYINEAKRIAELMYGSGDRSKVKLYTTEIDAKVVNEPLKHGKVIIATNIAGRGTDIKTSPVIEQNGGLHVLITFLPENVRVEQQNVGRTSRTGNKGTSQLILLGNEESDVKVMKERRNESEEELLKKAKKDVKTILDKDKIFKMFCTFLKNYKNKNIQKAIEERFAIWLLSQGRSSSSLFEAFKVFESVFKEEGNNKLIKNPYFYVLSGNKCLGNGKYDDAISEYTKAIALDPDFADNAYYNQGFAKVAKCGSNVSSIMQKGQINEAIEDFRKSRKLLNEKLNMLHVIAMSSVSKSSQFSEQLRNKNFLHNTQLNSIEFAVGCDTEEIDKEIEYVKNEKIKLKITDEDILKIDEYIERLKQNKENKGMISKLIEENKPIAIEFLDIHQLLPPHENVDLYKEEIEEFNNNGFISSFKVSESKPFPWLSALGLGVIVITEAVVGAVLLFTTGPTFGLQLVFHAFEDIFALIDCCVKRSFDWKSYGIQKGFKITVSIVAVGISTITAKFPKVTKLLDTGVNAISIISDLKLAEFADYVKNAFTSEETNDYLNSVLKYGMIKTVLPILQRQVSKSVGPKLSSKLIENKEVVEVVRIDIQNSDIKIQKIIKEDVSKNEFTSDYNSASILLKSVTEQLIPSKASKWLENHNVIDEQQLTTFIIDFDKWVSEIVNKYSLENIYSYKYEFAQDFYARILTLGNMQVAQDDMQETPEIIKGCKTFSKELSEIASAKIMNIIQEKLVNIASDVVKWGAKELAEKVSKKDS